MPDEDEVDDKTDDTRDADAYAAVFDDDEGDNDEMDDDGVGDEGDGDGAEIEYELDDWAGESRSLVDRLLTTQGILHAWQGGTLVVRADDEDAVDAVIDDVEMTTLPALDPDADKIAYEVAEWSDEQRTTLGGALAEAGIPYEWDDGGDLVVQESDDERVEAILDTLDLADEDENADEGGEDDDTDDGLAAQNVLSELFVSSDRLMHDAQDHEGVLSLVDAAHMAEDLPIPFGFSKESWGVIVTKAVALREAFESDTDDDDDAIMEQAAELRALLRNYV